jgi:transcriptional regulator with XRE-family HTH domain
MAAKNIIFAKNLEQVIKESGLSAKDFAKKAGVRESTLGTYISERDYGRVPRGDILAKLAKAANKSVVWLLTGIEEEKYSPEEKNGGELPGKGGIDSLVDNNQKNERDLMSRIPAQIRDLYRADNEHLQTLVSMFTQHLTTLWTAAEERGNLIRALEELQSSTVIGGKVYSKLQIQDVLKEGISILDLIISHPNKKDVM